MTMDWELFVTLELGDNSYLVASGGEAALIDPQRDAWRFLATAASRQLTLRYVVETHVHNDYLSGALEVRASTGAEIAAPARGNYQFPYRRIEEGAELRIGALRLVAWDTPGHTPEHISWLVYEDGSQEPVAVFSGGSLMVGTVGRTDLLGAEHTESLARSQFGNVRRLLTLPESVQVLPTHGAGSFCGSSTPGGARTTTIGAERHQNVILRMPDEESFVRRQLSGLLDFPTYYRHIGSLNRAGPKVLEALPLLKPLPAEVVAEQIKAAVWVVDGRDRLQFAAAHIPGSLNIELDLTFSTYVGWVIPFNSPLLLVLPQATEPTIKEAVTQLIRIGYERVEGYLDGGIEAWREAGRTLASYPTANIDELCQALQGSQPPQVLDVRQRLEWDAGHIPDSRHIFVGDLPKQLDRLPRDKEVWVLCSTGHRASLAASLLDRARIPVRMVSRGGVPDWLARR
ncbi:MAG: MBL fold metallo-hydrolase [Chloroflexi bacterium]|nr:MBL fold metallo-hydrolase [Chloroflexota bacterium]